MEGGGSARTPMAGLFVQEDASIDPQVSFKRSADEYMPVAHLARIMRRALPPHAKISEDTKETMQECVSEFINFVTSAANEHCHGEYRKTISAEDVIAAMGSVGLDSYVESLNVHLFMHRARDPKHVHHESYARRGTQMAQSPAMLPSQMGGYSRGNSSDGKGI